MNKNAYIISFLAFVLLIGAGVILLNKTPVHDIAFKAEGTKLTPVTEPIKNSFKQTFLSPFENILPSGVKEKFGIFDFSQKIADSTPESTTFLSFQSAPTPALTEKQVFDILYPPDYIENIKQIQNSLVNAGLLNPSLKIENINSEEEVIQALNNNIEGFSAGGYFNALEIIDLKYHLYNTFKKIKAQEKESILKNPEPYLKTSNIQSSTNTDLKNKLFSLLGIKINSAYAQSIPLPTGTSNYQALLQTMTQNLFSQARTNTGIPSDVDDGQLSQVITGGNIPNSPQALEGIATQMLNQALQDLGVVGTINPLEATQVINGETISNPQTLLQGVANQILQESLGNLGISGAINPLEAAQVINGGAISNPQQLLNLTANQIVQSGLGQLGLSSSMNVGQVQNILSSNISNPQQLLNTVLGAGLNYGFNQNGLGTNLNTSQISNIVGGVQNPQALLQNIATNVITSGLGQTGLGTSINPTQVLGMLSGNASNPQGLLQNILGAGAEFGINNLGIGGNINPSNLQGMLSGGISNPQQLFSGILNGGLTQIMGQAGLGGIPIGNLSGMLNGTISNPQGLFSNILNGGLGQIMGQAGLGGIPIGNLSGMLNGTISNPQGLLQSTLGSVLGNQLNINGLGGILSPGQATGILTGSAAPQSLVQNILGGIVGNNVLGPLGASSLQVPVLGQLALAGPTLSSVQGGLGRIATQGFQLVGLGSGSLPSQTLGALSGGATGLPLPGLSGQECYREGTANNIIGTNSSIHCCNCGLKITPTGVIFIPNCDPAGRTVNPSSALCDIPQGCLNLICFGNQPAIWDPQTKMCGCSI